MPFALKIVYELGKFFVSKKSVIFDTKTSNMILEKKLAMMRNGKIYSNLRYLNNHLLQIETT